MTYAERLRFEKLVARVHRAGWNLSRHVTGPFVLELEFYRPETSSRKVLRSEAASFLMQLTDVEQQVDAWLLTPQDGS